MAEEIAIPQALDEVFKYFQIHRAKNTTNNYGPKQKGGGHANAIPTFGSRRPR